MGIFDGKVAIITGGGKAKSIGYGIAVAYAKEGANLVLTGRNEQKLLDAKEELERLYGIKVLPLTADVTPDEESEEKIKEVVQMAPMERILLETDSPYLAPVPYRGKRNSSLYLPYVVQEIAELKGISEEEVIETTEKNAVRLFRAEE